jgi:serine/threonine protein kinase/tetratricopeptide (TPR) repeat protein
MKPERWQQVENLYHAALGLGESRRAAFLDQACGGDEALRREIESLLEYQTRAENFIESPAIEVAASILARGRAYSVVDRVIGPYRVIKEIGQGGMGEVLQAVRADDQYKKQVAIKLVKPAMGSDFILNRFLAERQILASLDHPNIARLHDGGVTTDGLPYFVMEYIEGVPINEYCDERRLTTIERLKLFRKVCSAVHYAHQNLIIHRDIKPTNILVTADGEPKLLDFGIAKLLDPDHSRRAADQTAITQRLMTPGYASPEQAMGEPVTTASDVYSLGVLLYELLTGLRPYYFKSDLPFEIARVICEQEPVKPSTAVLRVEEATDRKVSRTLTPESISKTRDGQPEKLRRRLAGDVDMIVLMAMRKEPHRRYASVEQFSEDIRRHLKGLPVIARKDTFAYRSTKFVKRNKAAVIAAALILMTLIAGIVATTWQARVAETERARSERRFDEVRHLANSFMFEFHDDIANLAGSTRARERLVKKAIAYLDSLAEEAAGDSALQLELAMAYQKLGDIQGNPYHLSVHSHANLGDTAGALTSYNKAEAILEGLKGAGPIDAGVHRIHAHILFNISSVLHVSGDNAGASEKYRKGLTILEELASADSTDAKTRSELAKKYESLLVLSDNAKDVTGSIEYNRKALAIYKELVATDPANADHWLDLAICYRNLGGLLAMAGDKAEALENNRKSLEYDRIAQTMFEELMATDPINIETRRQLIGVYIDIGQLLVEFGDRAAGIEYHNKALAMTDDTLLATDVSDNESRHHIASLYRTIGRNQSATGDIGGALKSFRKALEVREAMSAADITNARNQRELALSYTDSANALAKSGDRVGALEHYRRAASIREAMSVADPANIRDRRSLASLYSKLGEFYATIAQDVNAPTTKQVEAWREARRWRQRNLEILLDMHSRGLSSGPGAKDHEKAAHEVAKCDAALANLQGLKAPSTPR